MTVKVGEVDALLAAIRPCSEATLKEDGAIAYVPNCAAFEENTVILIELWRDMDAFQKHLRASHLATFFEAAKPLLVELPDVQTFEGDKIT